MKQTSEYQLNQWEKSDRIMMEDFNADNAKIEQALQELNGLLPIVKLGSSTVTAQTQQVNIDLSSVDWDEYVYVLVRIDGYMSNSSGSFYVRMNGYAGNSDYYYDNNSANYACYCMLGYDGKRRPVHLLVSSQGRNPEISCHCMGATDTSHGILNKEETANTLTLVSTASYTVSAGTKIELYGIRL